ncbi:MAG: TVP38/TMEM64 family protein [Candidatus Nanohaloarchaea archaeon]
MQVFSSRKRKIETAILAATVSIVSFIGFELFSSSFTFTSQRIAGIVGPYGPPGVILAQFAQVMIAPLPPAVPVVSGMLYGAVEGTLYSFIGAAIGSLVALLIARRYGRSAVEKFLSDEGMEKFDRYTSGHGYLPFLVLFVFPGFPDDALCFVAGLTDLDLKKLFLMASIGRIPGIALLATTGSSAANANPLNLLGSASLLAGISLLSVKYERRLENYVARLERESFSILKTLR